MPGGDPCPPPVGDGPHGNRALFFKGRQEVRIHLLVHVTRRRLVLGTGQFRVGVKEYGPVLTASDKGKELASGKSLEGGAELLFEAQVLGKGEIVLSP
ncbi:hypothetical protein SDC9_57108 [bioreactor metagenome]|uniref:Uncharacterized protein n=1 Tax=bioreactor metagenome TaxID=1076179 RepID=A0A644X936_9ZZZZ